jgi:Zn ribbon nucleic-acid-binding protein
VLSVNCPACTSDDLVGSPTKDKNISLTCLACGHVWERTPFQPCKRCGSSDVTLSLYEGWAYDDLEEAREDTYASWEYVERTVFRCRKCNYEWVESGATRRPPKLPPKPTPAPISIDDLWGRLDRHQGDEFTQIRGGTFAYALTDRALFPDRTAWQIPRTHFEEALGLVPLKNTVVVQHLYGPSYIYALLMDRRIRKADW